MSKWYASHSFNPADAFSVQEIPNPGAYTDLVTDDHCLAYVDGVLHILVYDSTDTSTEQVPQVIVPHDNATGTGRWLLSKSVPVGTNGFDVKVGPPTTTTLTFTPGTRTFSIQPTGADFDYYVGGKLFTSTGDTVVITDVEGLHWIYYDTDGTLTVQAPGGTDDDLILTKCLVGNVYWNATDNDEVIVGDERHGYVMSPATHYHFHECLGSLYDSGLSLGNFDIDGSGADATAAQFDVADGTIHDEDIEHDIEDGSPQQLVNATIPTLYRLGVGGAWRKLDATANFPVADGTIDLRLDWNDYNGGTWQLLEVTNNNFVLTHYFATNDINTPIVGIMGQNEYANRAAARTGAEVELLSISLAGLPGAEYVPIATVIWQTNDTYTNQVAARIRSTEGGDDYIDWREAKITGSGSSTVDHESLANLLGGAAADHYHLTSAQETDLTDGGESTLHYHNALKDGGQTGAQYTNGGALQLFHGGAEKLQTTATGIKVGDGTASGVSMYYSSDDFYIDQLDPDGLLILRSRNAANTNTNILARFDPDLATELFYGGIPAIETTANGMKFYEVAGSKYGLLYSEADGDIILSGGTNSRQLQLQALDSTGAAKTLLAGWADNVTTLYYNGTQAIKTDIAGMIVYDTSGNNPIIYMSNDAAATQGSISCNAGSFTLTDLVNSQTVIANNAGASVNQYYAGGLRTYTTAAGFNIQGANDTQWLHVFRTYNYNAYNAANYNVWSQQVYNDATEQTSVLQIASGLATLTDGAEEGRTLVYTMLAGAATAALAITSGNVQLYSGGAVKISTGSSGVSVTGNIAVTGTVDGVDIANGTGQLGVAAEWTKAQNFDLTTLTDGATINWDVADNQVCQVTLAGNRTMAAPTNIPAGTLCVLAVIQDATGSRTLSWNAAYLWGALGTPVLGTAASFIDVFTFISDGTNLRAIGRWKSA